RPVASGPKAHFGDLDGEDHILKRRLLSKHLNSRRVELIKEDLRKIIRNHIADFKTSGQGTDAIVSLANKIPTAVMSRVLGIPTSDGLEMLNNGSDYGAYFEDLTGNEQKVNEDGLFNTWMNESGDERKFWTDDEVRNLAGSLLTAGHA